MDDYDHEEESEHEKKLKSKEDADRHTASPTDSASASASESEMMLKKKKKGKPFIGQTATSSKVGNESSRLDDDKVKDKEKEHGKEKGKDKVMVMTLSKAVALSSGNGNAKNSKKKNGGGVSTTNNNNKTRNATRNAGNMIVKKVRSSKSNIPGTSRYWTPSEHKLFMEALIMYGPKELKNISSYVGTRNMIQCRTHEQKCFMRLMREAQRDTLLRNGQLTHMLHDVVPTV